MNLSKARELYHYGVIEELHAVRDYSESGWNLVFVTESGQAQNIHYMRNTHGNKKVFKTFDALCRDVEKITLQGVSRVELELRGEDYELAF